MNGERITRFVRGILHHDTFELFVAPAIADLQHARSAAAYATVWVSVAAALGQDLVLDAQHLRGDIRLMLGLIAIQVCYYGSALLVLVADVRADQMLERLTGSAGLAAIMVVSVVTASAIPTLACLWPPRRTFDA